MTQDPRIQITHFEWTIQRLEDILKNEKTDYFRDAALERFGFTHQRAEQSLLAISGQEESDVWQWAKDENLVQNANMLAQMQTDYGRINGPEKNQAGEEIYSRLKVYCAAYQEIYDALLKKIE